MELKIIQNNMNSPLLVYDGGPPKKIIFKIKNEAGKLECKLDLGEISRKTLPKAIPIEEFNEIDELLNFPRKRLLEEEEIVAPVGDGPLYFGKGNNKDIEYTICFTIFEKQPGRYQCYVLAIIASIV